MFYKNLDTLKCGIVFVNGALKMLNQDILKIRPFLEASEKVEK